MRKKITPVVSLQYVQSLLQASTTDKKHTTTFKNKQEQKWALGSIPQESGRTQSG
jgi:hypothetical protein